MPSAHTSIAAIADSAFFFLAGAESVLEVALNRLAGYRAPSGKTTTPNRHAPDQTGTRPQLVHCDRDLAAPDCCDCTSN